MDSVFRALWLTTQSVNIMHYSLIHLQFLRASDAKHFLVNPKIRMSLPKFDSPGCVLHGFTHPSVSVLFLSLGGSISVTVCRSLSSSCLRASFSRYRTISRYFCIFIAIETASLLPQLKCLKRQLLWSI